MKKSILSGIIGVLLFVSVPGFADPFELGTCIEKKGEAVTLTGSGYTRLSLVRFKTGVVGTIHLDVTVAVSQGSANLVMWSKVKNNFYFTRLPGLQNYRLDKPTTFSIPFNSPADPITEVVLEIELPDGGKITLDQMRISKN